MMNNSKETKIIYHIDDEETPYLVKVAKPPEEVTLFDFKSVLNRPNFKFFFKSMDDDFGIVKEEIVDDTTLLPCINGRVVSWLVTADGSVVDGGSNCGDIDTGGMINSNNNNNTMELSETDSVSHRERVKLSGHKLSRRRCSSAGRAATAAAAARLAAGGGGGGVGGGVVYDSSSALSSELESTSFFDSDDDDDDDDCSSRMTSTTEGTSVSRQNRQHRRRHRRSDHHSHLHYNSHHLHHRNRHHHHHHHQQQQQQQQQQRHQHRTLRSSASNCGGAGAPRLSRSASYSSLTDSTVTLNVITVTLNMEAVGFLGISIVGQSNRGGDGGIYVGSIMKGGAVALDGRIEPGDMILQVNDINFEHMSNDAAVHLLRDVVQKPGPVRLVVAKCWAPPPPAAAAPSRGHFTLPRTEPVRPIDPGAWVAHTAACQEYSVGVPSDYGSTIDHKDLLHMRQPSLTTLTSSSPSLATTVAAADGQQLVCNTVLSVESSLAAIARAMASPASGLEVRDRMWLKIVIPNAFIGCDVVEWLYANVTGFQDRKEARKFAAHLLRAGLIRHTVNKNSFSEQCYYVFGDTSDGVEGLSMYGGDGVERALSVPGDMASTYCATLPPPPASSSTLPRPPASSTTLPSSVSHTTSLWNGHTAARPADSGSGGSSTSSQRHLFYNGALSASQQQQQQQCTLPSIGGATCSSESSDANTVQSAVHRCTTLDNGSAASAAAVGSGSSSTSLHAPVPQCASVGAGVAGRDYFVDVM